MKIVRTKVKFLTKQEAQDVLLSAGPRQGPRNVLLEAVLSYCGSSMSKERALQIKQTLMQMGLTEFEAIQIIDSNPRSLLCLQLVIEEMESRFSEEDLLGILDLFKE